MTHGFGDLVFEPYLGGGATRAAWRTDEEVAAAFLASIDELFEVHGVSASPLLLLRVEDVLSGYLTVRRLEDAARLEPDVTDDEPARGKRASAAEPLAKARERLRKAMKELEEACAKAGTPVDNGLADRVKPLLKQTSGVLEDALSYEQKKRAGSDAEGDT